MSANPWRDVSPLKIRQHPPNIFMSRNWASAKVMTFFLVFASLWAKNWTSADVSILLNHSPQHRKMVDFAKSSPLLLNTDLHPCS